MLSTVRCICCPAVNTMPHQKVVPAASIGIGTSASELVLHRPIPVQHKPPDLHRVEILIKTVDYVLKRIFIIAKKITDPAWCPVCVTWPSLHVLPLRTSCLLLSLISLVRAPFSQICYLEPLCPSSRGSFQTSICMTNTAYVCVGEIEKGACTNSARKTWFTCGA